MKGESVEYRGTTYRYIITIQDVFSRFLWLRPIRRKTSRSVAYEIKQIYREHGAPRILQCDNGGEFRGAVLSAVKHIGVKIINSRAYHPQSQGKVERSHRGLRDKIRYDILRKGLPEYQSIINNEVKAEFGGKSPFQIYYSRTSNFILKPNADSDPESEGGLC